MIARMQRLVVAAVLLGGCDADETGELEDSESTGIVPSDETFGEESSTDDGTAPEYADGEMFGFCEDSTDCHGYEQGANDTTHCIAKTCVEWHASQMGWWQMLTDESPCTDPDSVPVPTAWMVGQDTGAICGLRARIADGLGYCPDGMTLATMYNETTEEFTTTTCWWSDAVVSGPMCATTGQCGGCEPQPYEAGGLPNVCR